MPVRVTQPQSYPGGRALVEVLGSGDRVADPVEIAIIDQMSGAEKATHLDPRTPATAWTPAVFWFAPETVRREGAAMSFDLDHGITFHLRPNIPYLLRLRGLDGTPVEERMVWRAIRGRSVAPVWAPPGGGPPVAATPDPEPPPESHPQPAPPPPPEPPLTAPLPPLQPPGGGHPWVYAIAALLLLALGGAGAWFLWLAPGDRAPAVVAETPTPPAARPTTVEEARRQVQAEPPAEQALVEARRFAEAGALDGAFLLYRRAAELGSAEAALALGAMYDPATHSAGTSPLPTPNPDQAAAWFQRAAETGNAEAQFRLGRVLLSGRTSAADGPEKGVMWLQKAAEQGHQGARDALPK